MPTYDYVCEKCGNEFEVFQSMNDRRLTKCPDKKCKGKVHRKVGTGAGFVFKGSGFYITDYRSESYKAAAKKDAPPSSDSSSAKSSPDKSSADKPAKKDSGSSPKKSAGSAGG